MSPAATMTAEAAIACAVDGADALFYERGLALVTMADVRDSAGVSLRRLYILYPSKRDLVAAWLRDRHVTWMAWFVATVDRRTRRGTDPLVATFDALQEWSKSPTYRGCAFLNSVAETSEIDGAIVQSAVFGTTAPIEAAKHAASQLISTTS